jgi:8-amino-7-oxononanoate synthase
LEKDIARWKKTEAALFFGSGYLANLGTISAIAGPRDVIFSDELNHSCILDGIRLSGAKKFFYRNLDTKHLQELLEKHRADYDKAFVITDTVFSMQGTCADLKSIIDLKAKYDFSLYLDEAHATGTMGQTGAGLYAYLVEAKEIEANQAEIQMGTFSKAAGVEGAYVAGSNELIDYLINFARTFIYSTASSPYVISMVSQNLKRLIVADDKRLNLYKNIDYFRDKLTERKIDYTNNRSPVFAINLKTNEEALSLSEEFLKNQILIKAIRPPTVPQPCLRICLHADHSFEDIDRVLEKLS